MRPHRLLELPNVFDACGSSNSRASRLSKNIRFTHLFRSFRSHFVLCFCSIWWCHFTLKLVSSKQLIHLYSTPLDYPPIGSFFGTPPSIVTLTRTSGLFWPVEQYFEIKWVNSYEFSTGFFTFVIRLVYGSYVDFKIVQCAWFWFSLHMYLSVKSWSTRAYITSLSLSTSRTNTNGSLHWQINGNKF